MKFLKVLSTNQANSHLMLTFTNNNSYYSNSNNNNILEVNNSNNLTEEVSMSSRY